MLGERGDIREEIVQAAYKWRLNLESTEKKPFHNWNVIFFMDPNNAGSYISIIEAGGGKAKSFTDHAGNYRGVTHAVLQKRNTMTYVNRDTLIALAKLRVPFYDEQLLSNFLLGISQKAKQQHHELHDEYHRRYNKKRSS